MVPAGVEMRMSGSTAVAIRISPRAVVLPANTLRFYIHFSTPGEAHFDRDQLRLIDEHGHAVREPFLILPYELWSTDGRRLTVLMEPGRIKRGMGEDPAHEPALVVGRTYSLVITALGHTARQTFQVGDPVLDAVDETSWQVSAPTGGSHDPIVVHFDRVMDAGLCESEIRVVDPTGEVLRTQVAMTPGGAAAIVAPSQPWRAGEHRLILSERLEDICGNRLGEALDHELGTGRALRAGMITFTPR